MGSICESILGKEIDVKFGKYTVSGAFISLGIKLGLETIENLMHSEKKMSCVIFK